MSPRSVESLAQTLVRDVNSVKRAVRKLENKNDLGYSSIEDNKALPVYGTDGTPKATYGGQFDGSSGAFSLTGPTPPMATVPVCSGAWSVIRGTWDGLFVGEDGQPDISIFAPMDFLRIEVHASKDPEFTAEFNDTIKATIETPRGREFSFFATPGLWYIRLVTRTMSGKLSTATAPVEVLSQFLETNNEFRDAVVTRMAVYLTNTNATGDTSEVNGKGIRVYHVEPGTGEIQERVRLGTHTGEGDYLALSDDEGNVAASMDKNGAIVGRTLDITDGITYKGTPLDDYIGRAADGIIAYAARSTKSEVDSTGQLVPYLRMFFDDLPGRRYRVDVTGLVGRITQNTGAGLVNLHWRNDGTDATINDPIIARCQLGALAGSATITDTGALHRIFSSTGAGVSLLISFQRNQSTGFFGLGPVTDSPVFMEVHDLGYDPVGLNAVNVGESLDGSAPNVPPPPPPPKTVTRTLEWGYSGVRSYLGNNATYAYNPGKGYQGLSPAGYGNLKSIWTFPSVTATLAGATIHDIWIKFRFEHWWSSAGGTALIRLHDHLSLPSTYSGTNNGMNKGGWPAGAEYWVRVPSSLYAGWKTGEYRGAALVGDGNLGSYGIANFARLRIRFTK